MNESPDPFWQAIEQLLFIGSVDREQVERQVRERQKQLDELSRKSSRTPLTDEQAADYLNCVVQTCYPNSISFSQ